MIRILKTERKYTLYEFDTFRNKTCGRKHEHQNIGHTKNYVLNKNQNEIK